MLFISCFAGLLHIASITAPPEQSFYAHLKEDIERKNQDENNAYIFQPDVNFSSHKPECSDAAARSLLLISTIDGQLSCLDSSSGKQLWNIASEQPLLSSSISYVKSLQDLVDVRFIPSLDGNLYKWNGQNVETVPLSTDYLLGQMTQLPDGSLMVGGKDIKISGVDLSNGKIYYECSSTGCKAVDDDEKIKEKNVLLLRRTQQTVRAIQKINAQEKWNFSVGKYELEFIEGDINEISSSSFCNQVPITPESLHFTIQDGIVRCDSKHWSYKYDAPIAGAWKLENNDLNPIDIFKYGILEGLPTDEQFKSSSLMYLGLHEGQMYIQQPLVKEKVDTFDTSSNVLDIEYRPTANSWRPLISTSSSRTPILNHDKAVTSLSSVDYPFDNGFVLVANLSTDLVAIKPDDEVCTGGPYDDTCQSTTNTAQPLHPKPDNMELVPLNLKDWWKEVLVLSVVIAIGLNLAARYCKRKFNMPDQIVTGASTDEIGEAQEVEVEEELVATIMDADERIKKRSYTNSISIATDPLSSSDSFSSTTEFESRYMVDFDHVQCLGKGGFGVVFKAKKKIDDCEYAIKRIYLPRCDEAKEKMMREVKALAALDHVGIVRYFHAWWEAPPSGWQNETDKEYLFKGRPDTPSYALSHDWLLEIHSVFQDNERSASSNSKISDERKPRRRTLTPSKCTDVDPMGKRYNFDTGASDIEEYIQDHSGFNLLQHNDVFFSDSTDESKSHIPKHHEDSFEICFESNSGVNNDKCQNETQNACSDVNDSDSEWKNDFNVNNIIETSSYSNKHATNNETTDISTTSRRRLVGKCCSRNSSCLTEPPLFLYIQMQLCQQATLKEWLSEKKQEIPLKESMQLFYQIVNAVEYFHSRGMMHRDLKPANIFFSLDGSIKVGDFGLVTAITRPSRGKHRGKTFEVDSHTGQVGTQLYMSPEQATGRPYSQKVDIYALGLIFFELLCFFSTQMERMQLIYRLKHGHLPDTLAGTPQGSLVKLLTSENPELRPEAKDIKTHEITEQITC